MFVSSVLYGTRALNLAASKTQNSDSFYGKGTYGKSPTKKEPIRTPDLPRDYLAIK